MRLQFVIFIILNTVMLMACDQFYDEQPQPQITAQGFVIENVQNGTVGQFGSIRLRIESKARIQKLIIKERSYQTDLATTPEKNHFELFGLNKRPLFQTDVTLDFQNFINKKMLQAGDYEITIEVIDKKNQAANATLLLTLEKPKAKTTPIETGYFKMQRKAREQIGDNEKFGITWKTIDEIKVTIRISKADSGASKIARFKAEDYDRLTTKEELNRIMTDARDMGNIEFDTTNNAAADKVVGIVNMGRYYLLKTIQSKTFLSQIGTTVTLDGEYKY